MQLVANELCHLNCIISFRYYGPWLVLCIVMVTFLMAISCVIHYRVSLFLLPTGFANHAYKYLIWCFVLIIVEETKQRKCRVCWTKYGCSKGNCKYPTVCIFSTFVHQLSQLAEPLARRNQAADAISMDLHCHFCLPCHQQVCKQLPYL